MLICLQCYMTFNNVILKLERITFGTNIYSCKLRSGLVNQFLGSRKQLSKASGIIQLSKNSYSCLIYVLQYSKTDRSRVSLPKGQLNSE